MNRLEFPLNINLYSTRPIFRARINGVVTTCMLDTGADMPVFCKGKELFEEWTKDIDGVSPFAESLIGGFGKAAEDVVLYHIPIFHFSDGKNNITYREMKIAVMLKPQIPCDVIISASMLMKMKYTIDCQGMQHFLTIEAMKQIYGVGYYKTKETIYIFTDAEKEA